MVFLVALCAVSNANYGGFPGTYRIDISTGEAKKIILAESENLIIRMLNSRVERDNLVSAISRAFVLLNVNGRIIEVSCGHYAKPVPILRKYILDCPINHFVVSASDTNRWELDADARIRLIDTTLISDYFTLPVSTFWTNVHTQADNEIVFVGGRNLKSGPQYHHGDFDFGGVDGLTPFLAASSGVLRLGEENERGDGPHKLRSDEVGIQDAFGNLHRYQHIYDLVPGLEAGDAVTKGQKLGTIGKTGPSGG